MKNKISRFLDSITSLFSRKKYGLSGRQNIIIRKDASDDLRDWAITNAGLDKLPYKGEGEIVGILDTGVDPNHNDLKNRVEFVNFLPPSAATDENGHGTFCAGEILANGKIIGVAPKAEGFCCKVLYGDERDGYILDFETTLYNAIMAARDNGCGVLSMSIGFSHKSRLVQDALIEAVNDGIIPIAAAGNEGMTGSPIPFYPSSYSHCISVAGANEKGMPSWFSSTGNGGTTEEQPEVAVASQEYYWGCVPNNRYGKMIGTSMACPIIAGTALLWREAMTKNGTLPFGADVLKEFREWLKFVSIDTNFNGWDSSLGWGVLSVKGDSLK